MEIVTTEEHHVEHRHVEPDPEPIAPIVEAPAEVVHHVEAPSAGIETLAAGLNSRFDSLIDLQRQTLDELRRGAVATVEDAASVPEAAAEDAVEIPLDAVDPPPAPETPAPKKKKRRRF